MAVVWGEVIHEQKVAGKRHEDAGSSHREIEDIDRLKLIIKHTWAAHSSS
jgi:hypothetical protein